MARLRDTRRPATLVALLLWTALASATELAAAAANGPPVVRGVAPEAAALVRIAPRWSPTVARLLDALASKSVIVLVEMAPLNVHLPGDLRLVGMAGSFRYLIVRVSSALPPWKQVAVLGHELQHAQEIALAPEVTDQKSLVRLLLAIGYATGPATFETDEAGRVTRRIWFELVAK
jgi:hypothetical protein